MGYSFILFLLLDLLSILWSDFFAMIFNSNTITFICLEWLKYNQDIHITGVILTTRDVFFYQ